MNLKKTLLIASLGGAVASSAYAQPEQWFFRWSTTSSGQTFLTSVPKFNTSPTATYPDGRTLTGVQFTIIPPLSRFSGGIEYTLPVGTAGSANVTLSGAPGLTLGFNFGSIFTFAQNINASSGPVPLPGGLTTVPVSGSLVQPLTPLPNSPLWSGSGFVPISVRLVGSYSSNDQTPQGTSAVNLPVISSGIGFVQYTFTGTVIPEAETYVAGIALAGLVGWTAHRRFRR